MDLYPWLVVLGRSMALAIVTVLGMLWLVVALPIAYELVIDDDHPILFAVPALAFTLLWPVMAVVAVLMAAAHWATPSRR